MLLVENSCFLSTVLRTHFKEEYKAVMLLDENSCFLSTVLRTHFKEGYKAVNGQKLPVARNFLCMTVDVTLPAE